MLSPGMLILLNKIKSQENLIQAFVQIWKCFFHDVLPLLDCILYRVKVTQLSTTFIFNFTLYTFYFRSQKMN